MSETMGGLSSHLAAVEFFLCVVVVLLLTIIHRLGEIKKLLAREVRLLGSKAQENPLPEKSPEKTSAADLQTRMAELQRERFSPRIIR